METVVEPSETYKLDLAGEQVPLSLDEQVSQIERDQWKAANPETPAVYREVYDFDEDGNKVVTQEATLKDDQIERIERSAKAHQLDRLDGRRPQVVEAWTSLEDDATKMAQELKDHATERGIPVFEDIIEADVNEARQAALEQKLIEFFPDAVNQTADNPDAKMHERFWAGRRQRKEQKKVLANRRALQEILEVRDPVQFDQIEKDWQAYDSIVQAERMDEVHAEALKYDKKNKAVAKRKEARTQAAELDESYGGALSQIAELPIYRNFGAERADGSLNTEARKRVKEIVANYKDLLGRIDNDTEFKMIVKQAANDLRWKLGERLDELGASQEQIEKTTEQAQEALELWFKNMGADSNPLDDLEKFMAARNKERLWDRKRQRTLSYIGRPGFVRKMGGLFTKSKETEFDRSLKDVRRSLGLAIDPAGNGRHEGAAYLADPSKAPTYRERVLAQLQLARQLGRHESTLMKGALLFSASAREVGYGGARTFETLTDAEKYRALKRYILAGATLSKGAAARAARRLAGGSATAGSPPSTGGP